LLGTFNESEPLFIQIKERIEAQIMQGILREGEQIPSTTQIVKFYKINHITVTKGIKILVDEGIISKKRGVGMFVAPGAREQLLIARRLSFAENFVMPLVTEAHNLGMEREEVLEIINSTFPKYSQ